MQILTLDAHFSFLALDTHHTGVSSIAPVSFGSGHTWSSWAALKPRGTKGTRITGISL